MWKYLQTCSKHVFAWVWGFFSGFVMIVLSFWSDRKNHLSKKVPTWFNHFAFHIGNHGSICWMLSWVRKIAKNVQVNMWSILLIHTCGVVIFSKVVGIKSETTLKNYLFTGNFKEFNIFWNIQFQNTFQLAAFFIWLITLEWWINKLSII